MPGLYNPPTRAPGELIDDTKYNADHATHSTNHVPEQMDDFSDDVAEMQSVADPGEIGTESLATSLSEELKRLRNVIKEISGRGQWYETPTHLPTFRGLHLRTHPDADVAASKVMLVHADEIRLDNGHTVASWDRLVADIAASGAGGLDTGSEVASTWYEIYAIGKDDGTKNGLLHRAKDWSVDETAATNETGKVLRRATSTDTDKLAQSFTPNITGLRPFIDISLDRDNAPTGNIWVTIEGDNAGEPDGTPIATSDKLAVDNIAITIQAVRFVFRTPVSLTAATKYWYVLQADYTRSDTVGILWRAGNATDPLAGEDGMQFNGTTWSSVSALSDFMFKDYVEQNNTAVTMPAGYTGKALIGYVFNDSGSNFEAFNATNRTVNVLLTKDIGAITATIGTLADVSTSFPPIVVRAWWVVGNSLDATWTFVSPVSEGFAVGTGTPRTGGSAGSRSSSAASSPHQFAGDIVTEAQGVYLNVSGGTGEAQLISWEW